MNKISLQQFYKKNKCAQFLRFFFNVEMIYGKIHHYMLYMQYYDNLQEAYFCAKNLVENWNQINLDHKFVFIGYEKTFKIEDLLKQKWANETQINQQQKYSYFVVNI